MSDPIETNPERTDLPLLVIPSCTASIAEMFRSRLRRFDGVCRVRLFTDAALDDDVIAARSAGADALIVIGFHVGSALFTRLQPHVRCLAFGGTGVASYIDLVRAHELGVRVCNAVRYGDEAVGEHTVALMFELARHIGSLDRAMRTGDWRGVDGMELAGRILGLVGFGGIAKVVARIARGIGMHVLVWSRHPGEPAAYGATAARDLDELFATSDVVSLHLAFNAQTRGIITDHHLGLLKSGALFVNTARAELIGSGALLRRLRRGDVAAGLDVFDDEPLPADDPLCTLPNTVLTPHVAWRSDGAMRNLVDQCIHAVTAFFRGGSYHVVEQ